MFVFVVMAGVGNSAQKVETLAGMVKKRIKGLFQVHQDYILFFFAFHENLGE